MGWDQRLLVDVILEGCKVLALADNGSQVNTIDARVCTRTGLSGPATGQTGELSPAFGWTWWSMHMSLGICNDMRLQVREVAGYDEDVVFLVVLDESALSKRVPLVIGTCMLG